MYCIVVWINQRTVDVDPTGLDFEFPAKSHEFFVEDISAAVIDHCKSQCAKHDSGSGYLVHGIFKI